MYFSHIAKRSQVKYNNAMDQLERTSEKLQTAKAKCLEASDPSSKVSPSKMRDFSLD